MNDVLEGLKDGIRRFQREVYPAQAETYRKAMSEPQKPRALIVTCADSRIHPDVLTQARPGDVFVTRNIGNMVPTYGEMIGGVSGVLEFAVRELGVRHVAICVHTDCGAMKGLLEPESVEAMPIVKSWLTNAHAALSVAKAVQARTGEADLLRILTEENVSLQMRHLLTHPSVAGAVAAGELTISGWVYDIAEGQVRICEGVGGMFEVVGPHRL